MEEPASPSSTDPEEEINLSQLDSDDHYDPGPAVAALPESKRDLQAEYFQLHDGREYKFRDSVHGEFSFNELEHDFIRSLPFQRLTRLSQLGCCSFVFPAVRHTRYEHSLGVAWLAYSCGHQMYKRQGVEPADLQLLTLAGLCHDLGHGPFSHVFESMFLPSKGIHDWSHEQMSCNIIDTIVHTLNEDKSRYYDTLSPYNVQRVKDFITPTGAVVEGRCNAWCYDIVANYRNGLDVDKIDYLQRDALPVNVNIKCDFQRLMNSMTVVGGRVGFVAEHDRDYDNIYQLYNARATMHREVYQNRRVRAAEYMVVDALHASDPVFNISDKIRSVEGFVQLDDDLVFQKLRGSESAADEKALRRCQELMTRVQRGELYMCTNDLSLPAEEVGQWRVPQVNDVVCCQEAGSGVELRPEDVILNKVDVHFGMKDANPLQFVNVWDAQQGMEKLFPAHRFPSTQEQRLRVYCRKDDPAYCRALRTAVINWHRRNSHASVVDTEPEGCDFERFSADTCTQREAKRRRGA